MHPGKPALFGLLACFLAWAWFYRAPVVDAYQDPSSPVELKLDGIDLTVETTPLPPSPFNRVVADDTGRVPPALAFIDPEPAPAVAMTGGSVSISGTVFGTRLRPRDDDAVPVPTPPTTQPTLTTGSQPDGVEPGTVGDDALADSTTITEPGPGPLERGVVRLERHTTNGIGVLDLAVDNQGRWGADELPGGRYRLRAWIPGVASSATSEVFFLADGETSTHRLELLAVDPSPRLQLVDGGAMYVGLDSSLGAVASRRWIDDDGLVVTGPIAGASVTLSVSGPLVTESSETATTDSRGLARFRVRCSGPGPVSGTAIMEGASVSGPFPSCQAIPAPPAPDPGAGTPGSSVPEADSPGVGSPGAGPVDGGDGGDG